jgi:YbbR domain-containing protein
MDLLRGWLFDNLGLKLTALLLAMLVYLNVYTDRPATMLLTFTLEYTGLPDSLTLSGPSPAVVQAELRGTGKRLIGLRVKEPRLQLSLLGARIGRYERALSASDLPLPSDGSVTVENLIGPRVIEIEIDRKAHRDLPVAPRVEGEPADGFAWTGSATLTPGRVRVTGPQKVLLGLDSLRLMPVRLDGKRDTLRVQVGPERLPDWCTAAPAMVTVRLPLVRATGR